MGFTTNSIFSIIKLAYYLNLLSVSYIIVQSVHIYIFCVSFSNKIAKKQVNNIVVILQSILFCFIQNIIACDWLVGES